MNAPFDRSVEDLGNSVGLEHLNLTIPDQQTATLFYIVGLGLTRDPYLVTGLENMWVNVGRSQFHLPMGKAQSVRGYTGLVMPDLKALVQRLANVKDRLRETRFAYSEQGNHVDVTDPWGGRIRVHAPDKSRFGPMVLGMPYISFDVPKGTADGIGRFYRQIIGAPATTEKTADGVATRVAVGHHQDLVFTEAGDTVPEYDGHHLQLYVVNFSGPHKQLNDRGLVTEESNQYQYRFKDIVDPDSGKVLYALEHEIRSITHPLYARPLVNRNPGQTNRDYVPGHDAAVWAAPVA
jgi:YD repeat-containing protein